MLHRFVLLESCVIHLGCMCVWGIPVFLCLSKQSKAVSGGNAGKCWDDKHSRRMWGEHTPHRTNRVWGWLERNKRETSRLEGRKKTYRWWETGWGRWEMQKCPAVLLVWNWGQVSDKSMLTVVLQLFKHPVYDVKPLWTSLPHLPPSPSDHWPPRQTYLGVWS